MKKTESKSIETICKEKVFRLFDIYDLLRGKATRMQSLHMAVVVIVVCISFAFLYILFFSYIPSDTNRSSLISLITNSGQPSPPVVQRLLTREEESPPVENDWLVAETSGFQISYPSDWLVEEEASPTAVLSTSDGTGETYVQITALDTLPEQSSDQCDQEEYTCSVVTVGQTEFQEVVSSSPESDLVIATMSPQQRDILYTIEYQYPVVDPTQAAIIEEILDSISFR